MMEELGERGRGCGDNVRESWSISGLVLPKSPPTGDQVFNLKLIEDISFKLPIYIVAKIIKKKKLLKRGS